MSEVLEQKPYYFLHTFVGSHSRTFGSLMMDAGRGWAAHYKIDTFLDTKEETADGLHHALGLDLREVMCTVSKPAPELAVTYHDNYGLVLEGAVKACFDNDSGCALQANGTYNDFVFRFTNPSTPQDLMEKWYDGFTAETNFTWNEVVLHKGARVAGFFYDPNKPPSFPDPPNVTGRKRGEDYEQILQKAQRCGLAALHINAKF